MKFEPKKSLDNIDITLFQRFYIHSANELDNPQLSIMGVSADFKKLGELLLLQRDMAIRHGSATREIYFKKPGEFKTPLDIKEADKEMAGWIKNIKFLDSLKIKLNAQSDDYEITVSDKKVSLTCGLQAMAEAIELCKFREYNQTHGSVFISGRDKVLISSSAWGDWVGAE